MEAVHPFFEKAGMTGYRRPAHEFDLRMKAVLGSAGVDLETLGGAEEVAGRLGEVGGGKRGGVEAEMGRWWGRRHKGTKARRHEEGTQRLGEWLEAARG